MMWKLILAAGAGGFIGSACRFLINRLFLTFWRLPFPMATFVINILGCFIFGILFGILQRQQTLPPWMNTFLIVGFCGGFTTFSTFSYEALTLGIGGLTFTSFLYIAGSIVLGLLATWGGISITSC